MTTTTVLAFDELDARTAHDLFKLRQDVFVVEQGDPYDDLDGRDTEPGTRHVLLHEGDALVGCARVLDDGSEARIGRVVLAPAARGRGLSVELMTAAMSVCTGRAVVLAAQSPLRGFYEGFGFTVCGPEFLDGSLPHLPMRRPADA
ncbi:GNAT family N-acetyltransferase [Nocardioides acrostichi]|uniref:GNAT family N-acetyltransferase n=1 Tax=Nocardioides acrostichi TaxID=2784339 RepID=A0A930UV33_9ACTN|nr:GNAT family N-acetyltransferase [Nocardioides acrostichi]MBF4161398.1 GNAT family N-acetyltransferase [Nocardioides acrostichi]